LNGKKEKRRLVSNAQDFRDPIAPRLIVFSEMRDHPFLDELWHVLEGIREVGYEAVLLICLLCDPEPLLESGDLVPGGRLVYNRRQPGGVGLYFLS